MGDRLDGKPPQDMTIETDPGEAFLEILKAMNAKSIGVKSGQSNETPLVENRANKAK